jgi:hypothetical protein
MNLGVFNLRTKLYYDYDELSALLGAEIDGVGETLENPQLLYVRETKNNIIETTLNDYFTSGRVLKYHNKVCKENGYDDEIRNENDQFVFEEDRRILKDYLKTIYPNFVNVLILDYKQEQQALREVWLEPQVASIQTKDKILDLDKKLEEVKKERSEIIERETAKTHNAVMTIEFVFALINGLTTLFMGLLGIVFKPLLLLSSFTLFATIGFFLAIIHDIVKNSRKYR